MKVKWALESITTNKGSGGDGIPSEVFQILKDDTVKVLYSICQQIWKTQQWPQDWRSQFSFQCQRRAMPEDVQTTTQLHSSHMLAKQGFNSTWSKNFQMFKLDLGKAEEPDIKLPISTGSQKKQQSSRTTSTSVSLTMPKPLTVWVTRDCGETLKRWEYQTTLPDFWDICTQVK